MIVTLAVALASCGDDNKQTKPVAEAGYAEVIQWFVDHHGDDEAAGSGQIVYLAAQGEGLGIGLETQAVVVSASDGFAEVRFVDDDSEALDSDGVRDGGIFLRLGPAIVEGRLLSIECERVLSDALTETWSFEFVARQGSWQLSSEPTQSQ